MDRKPARHAAGGCHRSCLAHLRSAAARPVLLSLMLIRGQLRAGQAGSRQTQAGEEARGAGACRQDAGRPAGVCAPAPATGAPAAGAAPQQDARAVPPGCGEPYSHQSSCSSASARHAGSLAGQHAAHSRCPSRPPGCRLHSGWTRRRARQWASRCCCTMALPGGALALASSCHCCCSAGAEPAGVHLSAQDAAARLLDSHRHHMPRAEPAAGYGCAAH